MTKGSCDPGPGQFNEQTLSKGNGTVTVTVRYGWDGVSVFPSCAGPIHDVRVRNTGTVTWNLLLPNGRQAKNRPIVPGADQTFSGAQLAAIGLVTLADIQALTLVRV